MGTRTANNVKLGIFVVAGLAFLVLLLYTIGKNHYLFGDTFTLKAMFKNVHGLRRGNNVRFAGIEAGAVKSVRIINDTTIEVVISVENSLEKHIRKDATATIGTDGLMGNTIVSIEPSGSNAAFVREGDTLRTIRAVDTDQMLKVLENTNNDIALVAKELKHTISRINQSKAFWTILNDESLPKDLRHSLQQMRITADNMNEAMTGINTIVSDIRSGKGTVGLLLSDTSAAADVKETLEKLARVGADADSITRNLNAFVSNLNQDVHEGEGTVNALLRDKEMRTSFYNSIENIQAGTKAFNENMIALRHNFLFRGYFKKMERQERQKRSAAR